MGNRHCPFSFVEVAADPPISAGELTWTTAPATTPPCASLTVPMSAPPRPYAGASEAARTHTATNSCGRYRDKPGARGSRRLVFTRRSV